MPVTIDEERFRLMTEALDQADALVTLVIKGDGSAHRTALAVAKTLSDLKRRHGKDAAKPR